MPSLIFPFRQSSLERIAFAARSLPFFRKGKVGRLLSVSKERIACAASPAWTAAGELCNRLICAAEYGAGRAMPTGNRGYAAHCQKLASRRRRLSKINSWSDVSATCCDRLPDVPAKDRVEAGSNPNLFRGCTTKTLVDEFSAVSMPNSPILQNRER